jgi:peptidoglycan/LPS O-acetylase OafA/YrhL
MAPAQSKSPVRYQLDFIDGLRALAALYIVTHHAVQTAGFVRWWTVPFTFGREVVVVFIAISGFCLGLPLARRGQWTLDARTFYRKRIRRILPPYYAALAVGFLIIAIYAMLGRPQDYLGHRFKWAMIWSHIALVQNWMPSQFVTVDGPLWSISIECQIYLLFPLVAWLWHRTGRWITLGVLFLFVHLVTHFAHGGGTNFLFAFGVGLLGVDLAFRPQSRPFLLAGVAVSLVAIPLTRPSHGSLSESLIALATALLMAYCAQVPKSFGSRLLGWKPLAWIGTFSYSVYLVHSYVEILCVRWIASHGLFWARITPAERASVLVFVISPLAVVLSYFFHRVFERPFMGAARQRAEARLEPNAGLTLGV